MAAASNPAPADLPVAWRSGVSIVSRSLGPRYSFANRLKARNALLQYPLPEIQEFGVSQLLIQWIRTSYCALTFSRHSELL
jgi:hypothetical protein